MRTTPLTLVALASAILVADVAAQLTPAPGRRSRDLEQQAPVRERCFHRLALAGDTCDEQAADFVQRHAAQLGISPARLRLGPVRTVTAGRGGRRRYGLQQQFVHDFAVEGHGLTYGIDKADRIRSAHGVLSDRLAELPPPVLPADDARDLALALRGLTFADFRGAPSVTGVARLVAGEPRLLHRVVGVTRDMVPLAIEIDAHDASLVRVFEQRYDGKVKTGTHSYDDTDTPFDLGTGRGYVYNSVKQALAGKDTFRPLTNFAVSSSTPLVGEVGLIHGRFAQVFNADGVIIDQPTLEYPYPDSDPTVFGGLITGADLFDHTNTYVWIDRAGTWIAKALGTNPIDRAMPVYVNEDVANAFFSPSDPDGPTGFPGGFFLFGDFGDEPGEEMKDFSRDPSVVVHEYVHGVVDGMGATFGSGDVDWPERAVNEALADYGAASMLRDPKVGRVLAEYAALDLGLTGDALRDLQEPLTLQDDLGRVLGFPSGLPQEHSAGQIFGAYLWRARTGLKKSADETFLVDMLGWPQSSAEVGFPSVTPGNAADAYEAFYFGCVDAAIAGVLDGGQGALARRQRQAGVILGAALTHGLAGQTDDSTYAFDGAEGLRVALRSEFLGTLDTHTIDLDLVEGQTVSIVAKGLKKTPLDATFSGDSFTLVKDKKTNAKGTVAKYPKIEIDATGTYRLQVTTSGEGGEYALRVRAK